MKRKERKKKKKHYPIFLKAAVTAAAKRQAIQKGVAGEREHLLLVRHSQAAEGRSQAGLKKTEKAGLPEEGVVAGTWPGHSFPGVAGGSVTRQALKKTGGHSICGQ